MTSEQKLHKWLKEQLIPCDYQRIESNASGVPDVNIGKSGTNRWVELKVFVQGRVLLRKEQYAWGMRRTAHNDPVYVVAFNPELYKISVWNFMHRIGIEPRGKYVSIITPAHWCESMPMIDIKSILFPK